MENQRMLEVAEDLYSHYTNKSIESSELIPYFTNELHLVKEFKINKVTTKVGYIDQETGIENKQLAILTDEVRFCQEFFRTLTDRFSRNIISSPIWDLIDSHLIHPFLLFVRGRFIKWSDITLHKDSKYCVLVIEDQADDTLTDEDINILQLPMNNLIYSETNLQDEGRTLIFAFDDDGLMDIYGFNRIYMDQSQVGYIQLRLPKSNIFEDDIQVPDECQLYPSNVILFKDNLLYRTDNIKISPYNTLTIDDGLTEHLEYKMFYDKTSNKPYNNVSFIDNHQYLKNEYLNTKPSPEWLTTLHETFDYTINPSKSFKDNMIDFIEFTKKYNYKHFINKFKSSSVFMNTGYIGDLSGPINNRYFAFPRALLNSTDVGYMLFINGIMCNHITKAATSGMYVDLSRYTDDSVWEFITFGNDITYTDSETISQANNPDHTYFTQHTGIPAYELFCHYHPDAIFNLDYERILYKIDPSKYIISDSGIKFLDEYAILDDTIVYRVPITKFAYEKFVIEQEEDFNVHLEDIKFKYCTEADRYMVFINGYRIHSSMYRVIVPAPKLPFTDQAIYFNIVLKKGDIVEVFYTAMSIFDEVTIDNLDHSTETGSGVDQMGFIKAPDNMKVPLSKELQFFFVNGIKIPKEYLMDISYDLTRIIVNMRTIENLCIIGFDSELSGFFESLNLEHSKLDKAYDEHDKAGISIMTNTYTSVTNVKPVIAKEINDHALINEIIRYYYGPVNKGIPFIYEYDSSVYAEVDSAGNINIDVMDATKRINLQLQKENKE